MLWFLTSMLMRAAKVLWITLLLLPSVAYAQTAPESLDRLASDFWTWRAKFRPFTGDDVPRMEHASGVRDWSSAAIAQQRKDLAEFDRRWRALHAEAWPVPQQVDYRLVGSALARVHWELDVNPRWQRDPTFYVEQTLTALQDELLAPPPFGKDRALEIVVRAENIPAILMAGKANLWPIAPFAQLAISSLADIDRRLARVSRSASPLLTDEELRKRFDTALQAAAKSLNEYRAWLQSDLPNMPASFALGEKAFSYFLRQVALLPYTPQQLLAMAHQDFARVLANEAYERERNLGLAELKPAATAEEEIAHMARDEANIRRYLTQHEILSVPTELPHWTMRRMPDYLAALDAFGETDDFTGPSRLAQDGIRWIRPPAETPGYFDQAYAKDTRTTGVHEGVPGHYFQLSLAWRNPDAIRRHYYDSVANEGLGFYSEEMMLHAGLYEDSPRTREIIWNFARLRALRVEADVKLVLGEFTISQASEYLVRTVPMDQQTAEEDASFYATAPGLGLDYEIGKLQIQSLLADRRLQQGEKFSLRAFHDALWSNGNVPLSLQRWELLGDDSEIKKLDALTKDAVATAPAAKDTPR